MRATIWQLGSVFAELSRADKLQAERPEYRMALERKWHLLFAARLILEKALPDDAWRKRLAGIASEELRPGPTGTGKWVRSLYEQSRKLVRGTYLRDMRDQSFNHRKWMRSSDTVESLSMDARDWTEDDLALLR